MAGKYQEGGKKISIRDRRKIDAVTGQPVSDKARFHADVDSEYIKMVAEYANKYGNDPYTALAINLAETGFKQDQMHNPFMLGFYNPYGNIMDESMKFLADKIKTAKRLGKVTEEDILQVWNGTKLIKNQGTLYGIDTNVNPINPIENPVYGKRVVNLRDSVIKQNPDIIKYVEEVNKMKKKSLTTNNVPQLKCGGLKKRKMQEGGLKKVPYDNLKIKSLANPTSLAPVPAQPNSGLPEGMSTELISQAANVIPEILNMIAPEYKDNRVNPIETMKKRDSLGVAGDVAGSTLKGAATGMATAGPVGALIGGGAGLVASGLKSIIGSKKRKEEREKAEKAWSDDWASIYGSSLSSDQYGDGGKVEKVMHEFKHGQLHSGSKKGPKVRSKDQAIAIALSEAGLDRKAEGGKVGNPKDRSKPGGSNVGKYSKSEGPFAGPSGGSPKGSFPIGSLKRAKSALKLAHNAPNPSGIKSAVYRKYPQLKHKRNGGFMLDTKRGWVDFQKGGEVDGAGTGKSDSITKRVEDGSFIVPAENAKYAKDLGKEYLGWNGKEMADRNYPGTEVKLSDGEVLFTPEEVDVLRYHGVDLDSLAPNATEKIEENAELSEGSQQNIDQQEEVKLTPFQKAVSMVPEVAGLIQSVAGIAGMEKAGRMPDINVSNYLKELAVEQRKEAQYGLEPGAKTAMKIATERERRNAVNALVSKGGSAADMQANLQGLLATTINSQYQTELADAAEKARKKSEYARTRLAMGEQDYNVQQTNLNNWKELMAINADLLNAGISNIVGARKLKAEMDALKEIEKNRKIIFTLPK